MLGSELLLRKIGHYTPFHPRQFLDRPDCKSRSRRPTGTNHVAALVGKMPDMVAEVKKGDLLYQIEKPPFQAVPQAMRAPPPPKGAGWSD
jgi:hypothetical protein